MENNAAFVYRYSAVQNEEIQNIRKKYLPREENKIDTLRKLDSRVRSAGVVESLILGVVGCLIFGVGMCFGLDVLAGADWLTVLFCTVGAATMLPAYAVYKHVSRKTKEALTPKILQLSDELINS